MCAQNGARSDGGGRAPESVAPPGTPRVLLIEDDARLATLTARYLESHGARVVIAHDGPTGLREAASPVFDVVLLDLNLPGMDGVTVCQRLRERSDVPIVMLTARSEEADRVLGRLIYYVPVSSRRALIPRRHRKRPNLPGAVRGLPSGSRSSPGPPVFPCGLRPR